MRLRHRAIFGLTVTALALTLGITVAARSQGLHTPGADAIAFARQVSDLMVNELVAALFTEFGETTPENVPHGKQAISLIFNDLNRNMRLIGPFGPLLGGANNRPADRFEIRAVRAALDGGQAINAVEQVNDTWFYRRSVPLSNRAHVACVMCHTNFTSDLFERTNNPGQWVGALVLAVPIRGGGREN